MVARGVTGTELQRAADRAGVVLAYPPERKGSGLRFTLSLAGAGPGRKYRRRGFQRRADGQRRYATGGAVCWHGHREFMRELFKLAPDAVLITALARYNGAQHFTATFEGTGAKQVGSMADPVAYADLCDCEDGEAPEDVLPLCAQAMGCLCAAHAKGRKATGPCDANEGVRP